MFYRLLQARCLSCCQINSIKALATGCYKNTSNTLQTNTAYPPLDLCIVILTLMNKSVITCHGVPYQATAVNCVMRTHCGEYSYNIN